MEEKLYNHSLVSDYYCCEETQSCETAFSEALKQLLRNIRKDSGQFNASCHNGSELLRFSFLDYLKRVSMYSGEERIRKALKWLCLTHDMVYTSRDIIIEPTVYCNNFEIKCCCAFILYELYIEAVPILAESYKSYTGLIPRGSLSVLYNWWGEAYDDDFVKLNSRVLSLTDPEERAKVIPSLNWKRARERLIDDLNYYCDNPREIPEVYSDGQIGMHDFGVWRFFHDYRRRLYSYGAKNFLDEDKYNYLLNWCIETMRLGIEINRDCLSAESLQNEISIIQDFKNQRLLILMMDYYMTPLMNILSSLLSNWDIVKESLPKANDDVNINNEEPEMGQPIINPEIETGQPLIPTDYLKFRISDDDVQEQVYAFLSSRIGKRPGANEYLYFAALINMKVIEGPEFKSLRRVFPRYDADTYYNNFNHFFGEAGVYYDLNGSARTLKKLEKRMREIVKEIPALQSYYDDYITGE